MRRSGWKFPRLLLLTPEQERSFYLGHLAKGMEGPLNYTRTYKARFNEEKGK